MSASAPAAETLQRPQAARPFIRTGTLIAAAAASWPSARILYRLNLCSAATGVHQHPIPLTKLVLPFYERASDFVQPALGEQEGCTRVGIRKIPANFLDIKDVIQIA